MSASFQQIIGRYALYDEIASGGMATVHIGRLLGPVGFSRTVAVKRLHPQFAKDPEFVSMFVDEARLAARIRHPNVVPTVDVVRTEDELFLVMEYVQGESLARLMRQARRDEKPIPLRLLVPILAGILHGLHAAHTAKGERGEKLGIVHRDVSPQNVIVGVDGVARVFDFGIAKARNRLQTTREGQIKGKLAYMAPEQLAEGEIAPPTDVYAAAVVAWEALANQRLFDADNEALLLAQVLRGVSVPPSHHNADVSADLDAIVMQALDMDPSKRFASARAFAVALERVGPMASATEVGEWIEEAAPDTLRQRSERISEIESQSEIKVLAGDMISPSRRGVGRQAMPSDPDWMADAPSQVPESQLSSISVAGVPHRHVNSGSPWTWVAAGGAVMIGVVAAFAMLGKDPPASGGSQDPTAPASPAPTESDVAPLSSSPPVGPGPSAPPSASSAADPVTTTTSSARAVVRPPRPTGKPVRSASPPVGPKVTPPAVPAPNPCADPYYYENGIKKIKPQCR